MGARTILITGGTSGIGAGIASAFAAQGDRVTVTGCP
jgi:NAD(P)-dependent dehydrogenase (short-subunit alcohol dehydrogenase family)